MSKKTDIHEQLYTLCFVYRAARDPRTGRRIALKKLPNVFQSLISCRRVYRELKMLCSFDHDNVSSSVSYLEIGRGPLAKYTSAYVAHGLACWCKNHGTLKYYWPWALSSFCAFAVVNVFPKCKSLTILLQQLPTYWHIIIVIVL